MEEFKFPLTVKRVLVTGAAGFIGGHFVEEYLRDRVNKEVRVVALDKISYASSSDTLRMLVDENVPFYQADIRDSSTVMKACVEHDVDLIVNFAAETHVDNSIKDCSPFVDSNVTGVISLLDVCRRLGMPMLHVSTDEVYGPVAGKPFLEYDRMSPKNPYAATKAAAEHLIESYRNTFGVKCAIVRPTNNFGPRQHVEKFIPKYVSCLLDKRAFPLYGDGLHVREWLYVKDCARAIRDLAQLDLQNRTVNIGNEMSSMANIEVCRSIFKKISVDSVMDEDGSQLHKTISYVPDRPGHDRKYSIDCGQLRQLLPKFKFTPFEEGLEETVFYYCRNRS